MAAGKRWTVRDRFGNEIYLTHERWGHIVGAGNHPEMIDNEEQLKETVQAGSRRQDPLNPQKHRYTKGFESLPEHNTHMVVIVLFRISQIPAGPLAPNNYIVTAYMKEVG